MLVHDLLARLVACNKYMARMWCPQEKREGVEKEKDGLYSHGSNSGFFFFFSPFSLLLIIINKSDFEHITLKRNLLANFRT